MDTAGHHALARERRRMRTLATGLPAALAAGALAWACLHRATPGSWMRMPIEGVVSGTGRVSFPGIPDGSQPMPLPGRADASMPAKPGSASPVPGLAPSTAPVGAGVGTFVPFPAQAGVELAALGPRFGVGMPDPAYRWWVVGKAPQGFGDPAYDARSGSWSFTGIPEREGVYRLSMAWARNGDRPTVLSANVAVAPAAGGAPLAAVTQADGRAFVGQPVGEQAALHGYLLPLGGECATWVVESGALPPGLALAQGCLPAGTAVVDPASVPTAPGQHRFTLAATAPDGTVAATEQVTLAVSEPSLSMSVARHGPATADGRPVSYAASASYGSEDFPAPGYASGAAAGDWVSYGMEEEPPPGLSFSAASGTVSGVVRKGATGSFRLRVTMSRPDGSQETAYGDAVTYGPGIQAED